VELYTLDPLLRREQIIDRFESLIWTERWQEQGDFQLDIFSNNTNRNLLKAGTKLAMNESYRVMEVKTIEDANDAEGRRILTVKGQSIESMLFDRALAPSPAEWATTQKWTHTAPPAAVARKIFHDICVLGVLDPQDVIPFIVEGTFMPPSTIAEPIDPITVEAEPTDVYTAIKQICDVWGLGFRILRQNDSSQLYFDVYAGSNRTSAQTVLAPVIFTPELDNLQNTKELTSTENAKNVAYVYSPMGMEVVYAIGVDPEVEGFERRVLTVNATDITEETPDPQQAMIQRGNEELAKYRTYQAFDGEISQNSRYKYGRDYHLGDLVEMRNLSGVTNDMRVSEQIFVSDKEGERSYPTLSLNTFINTGSWLSWLNNKVWSELTDEEWADQP
jgi:hypothetical protein